MKTTSLLIMNSVWIVALATSVCVAAEENKIIVDHASYCGHDLAQMQAQFHLIGLPTQYGGPHAAVTHMALLGFNDGSYLELIAPQKPQEPVPAGQRWRHAMMEDVGPCAWAIIVADVAAEVKRLAGVGLDTAGPLPGTRKKPDGTVLQWETGAVRPGEPGSVLPFFIHDKTNRRQRVQPSTSLTNSELTGIAAIVIGVRDLADSIAQFRRAYGLHAPEVHDEVEFGARVAYFRGTPVMLATPLAQNGWLARRVHKYGDKPVAYLLGTRDFEKSLTQRGLQLPMRLAERSVAWFSPSSLGGMRLGVIRE